jgi:HAD superfamily hydrolase (TIGR01549 family)
LTREGAAAVTSGLLAICLDCGDTLVDEATEVKDAQGVTLRAELIPGALELVRELRRRGYRLALVADGPPGTFRNVLTHYGIYDAFEALAISDEVGCCKPDARMFACALERLGIAREDYPRTLMVGNYLERDIRGANALGMISVWLDWAPRRPKVPADASEVPAFTIRTPLELLGVIECVEAALGRTAGEHAWESRDPLLPRSRRA